MTTISRYLAPAAAAAMTTMLMSPQAIYDAVAGMHESMRAEGGRLLQAQDRARRLLLGVDDFADVWRTTPADTDGSPIDVMADVIAGHAKGVGPERMTGWPGPVLLEYLQRIAEADIGHPLVAHRDVLRQACHDMDQPEPDWSDLDAYVTSTQLLAELRRVKEELAAIKGNTRAGAEASAASGAVVAEAVEASTRLAAQQAGYEAAARGRYVAAL